MKFSEQWLRQWVQIDASTQELVDRITMAGLEVDGVESVAGEFSGVVVGEIVACEQHPDADKLRVTQVSTGSEQFQVVCGAPNARVGIKIPFATVGAKLSGDFNIKKAKLRGVESFGMLCSESELQISDANEGLYELPADAPVGEDIRVYLNLDDKIIDVGLTPNRGDCLGIAGLAREVSANFMATVEAPVINNVAALIDDTFPVRVDAPAACPRYVGRVIKNVDLSKKAPLWLTERLRRSGIRSIDAVVDVTNYVLLELGQPMHGFDLDQLSGGINVRMATAGEALTLLDGTEVKLSDDILVIADQQKPLAMAGVMGGEGSGVSEATRNIFLESAYFDPIALAGKARKYGLHTDSSHRFERGVDFRLQRKAIERATALIVEICGGEAGPVTEVASDAYLPALRTVTLRAQKVTDLLGVEIDHDRIEGLLSRLGLTLESAGAGIWNVQVPSWRFDISIEEDLVEELGRIYGYNNLPKTTPLAKLQLKQVDEATVQEVDIRRAFVARGYHETINFSFIDPQVHALFDPSREAVALANPISSDLAVMRTSLLPGLIKTAAHNLKRQQSRIRLFETGLTFIKDGDDLQQEPKLAALIIGDRYPEGWQQKATPVDFYDLKGDVEAVLNLGLSGNQFIFAAGQHQAMHPGQCAQIERAGVVVGHVGALHPSLSKPLDMPANVYLLEMDLKAVQDGLVTAFQPLSKFPEVRRDIALLVADSVGAGEIEQLIRESAVELLKEVTTFDVYAGTGIEPGFKSLALGLTFVHPLRTLKDDEISAQMESILAQVEQRFGAKLRG